MHNRTRIVAGTALALVMTATYAGTSAQAGGILADEPVHEAIGAVPGGSGHLLLAQATQEEELSEEERQRREAEQAAPAEEEEAAPAEEEAAPAEEEAAPAEEEAAPAEEEAAPAEQEAAPAEEEAAPAEEEAAPAEEEAAPAEEEAAPAEQEAAPAEQEAAPAEEEAAPAEEEAAPAEEEAAPAEEEDRAAEPVPGEPAPPQDDAQQPPASDATPPADGEEPAVEGEAEPVPGEPAPPQDDAQQPPASGETPPADGEQPPVDGEQPPVDGEQPPVDGAAEPVREAPILDSEKEEAPAETGEPAADETEAQQQPAEAGPPPTSDQEAQQFEEPVEVQSLREEEGRRIDRRERRRERREGADVLREIGDRVVIQLNNQVIVRSNDRDRIEHDAEDVYYEELSRGRTRETVVRANGVQVVTVYDRYGDVIRRSRVMPDGREVVLVYAGRGDREEPRRWRDPAEDLPPLRLTIPVEEYILDAREVRDEDVYYQFLDQPPVDQVRRLYSIDEVRYSARVRDSVRRIDLDTITFEFGSASISENEIPRLEGVADAMVRLLDENPGETFLIEGHTDAVGSDQANLALSDQRAESVATALTNVFGIAPENLVTQGYGEGYLKIDTQEPERENRRVAIRRITPLVAPVASSQ